MKRALVLAGGECGAGDLLQEALDTCELLIAANGGAAAAYRLGRKPDLVVGDLDSLPAELRTRLETEKVEVVVHPWRKDKTDLHIAMLAAVDAGATSITVGCALGGARLDHAIANLLLLGSDEFAGVAVRLVHGSGEAFVVRDELALTGRPGELLTLCSLSPSAEGVSVSGVAWPLSNASFPFGDSLGVSNYLTEGAASVSVGSGVLMVIHEHQVEEKADLGPS
jgi:thiamine pyrophosphokinase